MVGICCFVIGVMSLIWIFISDKNRMIVPVIPLGLLACSGAIWKITAGTMEWNSLIYSALIIVPFLYLYAKKGMGEGDILLMAALMFWFEPQIYLLVIASGFALGFAWGVFRIIQAGEFKIWIERLRCGVYDNIPEYSTEAVTRPDCVPVAAAVSMTAFLILFLKILLPVTF